MQDEKGRDWDISKVICPGSNLTYLGSLQYHKRWKAVCITVPLGLSSLHFVQTFAFTLLSQDFFQLFPSRTSLAGCNCGVSVRAYSDAWN